MTKDLEIELLTDEQSEIWEYVSKYTKMILDGELEKLMDCYHENYSGWNSRGLLPVGKSDIQNELSEIKLKEIISYNLAPVSISIMDDTAIVHYYFLLSFKDSRGNQKSKRTRNTDILLKQKDRWILIGDHVG